MELKEQHKQMSNRTRDIEIKNNLTVIRGAWPGDNGGKKREGKSRNMYKRPKDKENGVRSNWGWGAVLGRGESWGEKLGKL